MKRILLFAALVGALALLAACGDDTTATDTRDSADLDLAGREFIVHQAPG